MGVTMEDNRVSEWRVGLLAQIAANALSGLNATLVELALRDCDPVAFNVELGICGVFSTLSGIAVSKRSNANSQLLFEDWSWLTLIPPVGLAVNGLVTAFVIKRGGGIAKAFSSVAAILITSLLRAVVEGRPLSYRQSFVALPLALSGVIVYSKFPPPAR